MKKPLNQLTKGQLITDSQDLDPISEDFAYTIAHELGEDITGAVVSCERGDYASVWVTSHKAPWHVDAVYTLIFEA